MMITVPVQVFQTVLLSADGLGQMEHGISPMSLILMARAQQKEPANVAVSTCGNLLGLARLPLGAKARIRV
jgi:hypothetical protein